MNTGFYNKKNLRKTRTNVSKHKNQNPEKCRKDAESKLKQDTKMDSQGNDRG